MSSEREPNSEKIDWKSRFIKTAVVFALAGVAFGVTLNLISA